jgi:hypothetical protein
MTARCRKAPRRLFVSVVPILPPVGRAGRPDQAFDAPSPDTESMTLKRERFWARMTD